MSKTFSEKDIPHLREQIATKMYNPLYVPLVQQVVSCLYACGGRPCLCVAACVSRQTLRANLMVSLYAAFAYSHVRELCVVRRGNASRRASALISHTPSHEFAFAQRTAGD